jgi:hypothetical protein
MVEYVHRATYWDGEPAVEWSALRLVFEEAAGGWNLVGVIHHEQTI